MNNPKLRFKREDSTDYPEWKKTKIGKLTKTFSASRVHREEWQTEGVPFWRSSDVMAFHQHKENAMGKAFITNELYEELSAKSGKMMKDDILITGGGSIGVPYLIPNNEPLYVKDADLLCIQKSDSHYPKFLYQFFWSPSFRNYLSVISHKGTIAHYTITQINETPIMMPCLEEQQKIADFLSTVDEVIAQSEAEVQNLEQQKKAAMQKIFSQEVRFKCEDGTDYPEWNEKRMGEVCHIFAGGTPSTSVKEYWENGNIIWIPSGCVQNCVLSDESIGKKITKSALEHSSTKMIAPNTTLLAMTGATCGKVAFLTFAACANQSVMAFETSSESSKFIFYLFEYNYDYITSFKAGGAQSGINKDSCSNLIFEFPYIEEQQKIAGFLSAYDEAISYSKQELDKWKELKKGLLQQMFV